jgi:formylglycine-generating enzyme required for sulfatase activity
VKERWKRLREIHARALELPPAERAAFVARECAGDEALQREVLALLAAHPTTRFLDPIAVRPSPLAGQLPEIEGYVVERMIGSGGMGVVYLARQISLDRLVALKVLPPVAALTPERLERFRREARAAAKLRHPAIVQIHDVSRCGPYEYFSMDYVEGHDLGQEIRAQIGDKEEEPEEAQELLLPAWDSPDFIATAARLGAEIADGLACAHAAGIVHRDVKPPNILLDRGGHPCLVDFGLALDASIGSTTRTGDLRGTLPYMSPEQARATRNRIDDRTDVYSLGVVLYELLTLHKPFEGTGIEQLIDQILHREPRSPRKLNPRIPRDLEVIVGKAMAKRAGDRYPTAKSLHDDLHRFLRHEAIEARPPTTAQRALRLVRRYRTASALGLLGLLGLGGGVLLRDELVRRASWPRLTLVARSQDGHDLAQAHGRVQLRPVDLLSGDVLASRIEGPLPFAGELVEPGAYRIVVSFENGEFRELWRTLPADGQEHRVVCFVGAGDADAADMVEFTPGDFFLERPANSLCPDLGRHVALAPFRMDRSEVSCGTYRSYLAATGNPPPLWWPKTWSTEWDGAWDVLPVTGLSHEEAAACAEWLGKRLPTHAEWEWAARGAEGRHVPWTDGDLVAARGCTSGPEFHLRPDVDPWPEYLRSVHAVRSDDEACTPEGLFHTLGNVMEFTETVVVREGDGQRQPDVHWRYLMGGAWDAAAKGSSLDTHEINRSDATGRNIQCGFRCARSVHP